LQGVTIAQGGVLPNIQAILLPKKSHSSPGGGTIKRMTIYITHLVYLIYLASASVGEKPKKAKASKSGPSQDF